MTLFLLFGVGTKIMWVGHASFEAQGFECVANEWPNNSIAFHTSCSISTNKEGVMLFVKHTCQEWVDSSEPVEVQVHNPFCLPHPCHPNPTQH